MIIIAESRPVEKSSYVHLAYISAGGPDDVTFSTIGVVLGLAILLFAAVAPWRGRKENTGEPDPVIKPQDEPKDQESDLDQLR